MSFFWLKPHWLQNKKKSNPKHIAALRYVVRLSRPSMELCTLEWRRNRSQRLHGQPSSANALPGPSASSPCWLVLLHLLPLVLCAPALPLALLCLHSPSTMNHLESQINRMSFWVLVLLLVTLTCFPAIFLPVWGGYATEFTVVQYELRWHSSIDPGFNP